MKKDRVGSATAMLPYTVAYHYERLTPRQRLYCEYRAAGYPATTAARLAGYKDNGGCGIRVRAHKLDRHRGVQTVVAELARAVQYAIRVQLSNQGEVDSIHVEVGY